MIRVASAAPDVTASRQYRLSPPPGSLPLRGADHSFTGIPADTPALLHAAHRLRYQVFCVENMIFDSADNPGGVECDAYDNHSAQALLLHRPTQAILGTVRLVLHKASETEGSLPFHKVCRDPRLRDPAFLPLATTAEVGRFAISKEFRLLPSQYDRAYRMQRRDDEFDRLMPHMTLALINAALQMCVEHHVRHVCAVMEPRLLRLLARLGFHFEPLGPPVEYHGVRQPCFAELGALFARVGVERREVWEVTTDRGRVFAPAAEASARNPDRPAWSSVGQAPAVTLAAE